MSVRMAYDVQVSTDWPTVAPCWRGLEHETVATPFQRIAWLDAWYRTIGADDVPLLVEVRERATQRIAVLLALATTRDGSRVRFADRDVTDFNAPILGPAAATTAAAAADLWRAVCAALPPADAADLRKMPLLVGGRPNPLALLRGTTLSPVTGRLITFGASFEDYHQSLERRVRMEFERCWRVFQRSPGAVFERIDDETAARAALDFLDVHQQARMQATDRDFLLGRPAEAGFYRHDLARRLGSGDVVVTALRAGEELVAVAYGISDGDTAVILRTANIGGAHAGASPGRLIVHRTLKHLCETGTRAVDLSIGDYDYKRRMQPVATPLVDLVTPLSWRGRAVDWHRRSTALLRRYPALDLRLRRALGRRDPATGRRVGAA